VYFLPPVFDLNSTSITTRSADLPTKIRAMGLSARVVRSWEVTRAHSLSQTSGRCAPSGPSRFLEADPMGLARPALAQLIPRLAPTTLAPERVPALIPTGGLCPWRSAIT
jgi:hypothetical protein